MRWQWIKIQWIRQILWQFYDYYNWGIHRRNRQRIRELGMDWDNFIFLPYKNPTWILKPKKMDVNEITGGIINTRFD